MLRIWPVLLGALLGLLTMRYGLAAGSDVAESWKLAARYTARAGFPLLMIAFTASSLVRLWPGALTKALLRDRRWWGLGFAACHSIHLYCFLNFFQLAGKPAPVAAVIGGGAYVMLYAMVLTSTDGARRALGRNWKRLHAVGIYWLWLVYTFAYTARALTDDDLVIGVLFGMIAIAARVIRFEAGRRTRGQARA